MFLPLCDDTPRLERPLVTTALIAASALAFFYQLGLDDDAALELARRAGAIPWQLAHLAPLGHGAPAALVPLPLTILTSLFLHGDVWHLVGNLWFLWVFGSKLEGALGHLRFAGLYLVGGALAALLQVAAAPDATRPMIGASGAIAVVLGAYAVRCARARVRCLLLLVFFVEVIELPATVLLGLWFLCQYVAAGGGAGSAGVAWFAHLGGFAVGLVAARALGGRARSRPWRVVYDAAPWRPGPRASASLS